MNGKAVVAVGVAAGILSGVALAQADGQHGRRGSGPSGMVEFLGLTPEQREQWKTMREEDRKETEPLRAEGRELRDRLRATLDADKADAAAVGQAALAVKEHRDRMKASSEAFRARLRAQLTPEQAKKFDAFEAARGFGRGGRPNTNPLTPEEMNRAEALLPLLEGKQEFWAMGEFVHLGEPSVPALVKGLTMPSPRIRYNTIETAVDDESGVRSAGAASDSQRSERTPARPRTCPAGGDPTRCGKDARGDRGDVQGSESLGAESRGV